MSSHILDRHNYDAKMITNIEVMSAYFVDLFYNHLYFEGKKLKVNGSVPSITEGYKHALNAFIKSLGNARLYKKAVMGIHQYFMNYTSFTTISFAKCVDRLAANFVPLDYLSSLNNTQKMSVLRLVINQAIKEFTKKIVNEHLNKIIDHHSDPDNVRLMQDELIDCFLLEREAVYQRFVSSQTNTSSNETVNRLVAEKMQKEIKNLIIEKIQIKKENIALKKIIIKNNTESTNLTENIGNLETTITELREELHFITQKVNRRQTNSYSSDREELPDKIKVTTNNIVETINEMQEAAESPKSDTEKSSFISFKVEDIEPEISTESPKNSTKKEEETELVKIEPLVVPKKKRPSANLGEGVTLDDFY
jgi:hypothetical protein